MPDTSAAKAPQSDAWWEEFDAWWKERIALRSFPIPADAEPFAYGYAREAWLAAHERMAPADTEGHTIELREDGWTIQHPLACRPNLFDCQVNRAAEKQLAGPSGTMLGLYDCWLDAKGRFHIGEGG